MSDTKPPLGPAASGAHALEARPDFLVTLGLIPPCTVEDVKQAYLAKVKTAHPDVGGDANEFRKLQEAFERATEWAKFRASRLAWLSTWVEKYVEQDGLVAEIQRRGGKVKIEGVDWLRRSFGDDFSQVAEKVQGIELHGPAVDDKTIAWLSDHRAALTALRSLDLTRSAITDAGLQHVAAFPALRELDLSETKITLAGLGVLDRLPEVEWLGLRGTSVGWLGRTRLKMKRSKLQIAT
jgi:Leucine rich repeat